MMLPNELNTTPIVRTLAAAYERAPLYSAAARPAWRLLAEDSVRRAERLRSIYLITETTDPNPYPNGARDMFRDLADKRLLVSSANSIHPVWSIRENIAFRIVHDILGHWGAKRDGRYAEFDWDGEADAYEWHARILPNDTVRGALFTEVLGQAAYALATGVFAEQKVAFLW